MRTGRLKGEMSRDSNDLVPAEERNARANNISEANMLGHTVRFWSCVC